MEKLSFITITRAEYTVRNSVASCNHCGNCGGPTGCGAHCKGGITAEKMKSERKM